MDSLSVLVVLGAMALGVWWWRFRGGASRRSEAQLRRICLGDMKQMERLVDAELARSPEISRVEAVNRAIGRYQRDNR